MFGKRKNARPSDDAFPAPLHKKVLAEEPVLLEQASIRNGVLAGRPGWSVMVSKGAGRSRAPKGGDHAPDEGGTGPIGHVGCRTG